MFKKVTTLTEFILNEERQFKTATGSFTLLMTQIENAAKILGSHIRSSGLVDVLGKTGNINAYGDEVERLDEYANDLLVDVLHKSGQVFVLASEELPDPVLVKQHRGTYDIFFDPLDGSSNIDTDVGIGTIFSIYEHSGNLFKPGRHQVAAGYILYGPSVIFVYTTGNGVNGFTYDPAIGSFLLSHPNIKMPHHGNIYSINEGYEQYFTPATKKYLHSIKSSEKPYKLRYVGSMVSDIHRTLLKGGIFLYPDDQKHPHGKLRLLFEVNPMAMIVQQAGGMAVSGKNNPLDITPINLEQKVPIVLGSKKEVENYVSLL